ncbi:MAG: DUF4142 domain-containing protein [Solirubrobacterales bacterium]
MKVATVTLLALVGAGLASGCSQSPTRTGTTGTTSTAAASSDRGFVADAASAGMSEVAMAQLAMDRARDPDVRAYASHLAQDHSRSSDKLRVAASQAGVGVPARLDAEDQAKVDKLSTLSGTAFDRAFLNQMVADHQETVNDFEREASRGDSAPLRSYADQSLPALRQHLAEAQALAHRQGT